MGSPPHHWPDGSRSPRRTRKACSLSEPTPGPGLSPPAFRRTGFRAVLVDTNYANISVARMANLPTCYGNILATGALDRLDMSGVGPLAGPHAERRGQYALATLRLTEVFGRGEVYQLASKDHTTHQDGPSHELQGRLLFAPGMTYAQLHERFTAGATIKKTTLSERFDYAAFRARYGEAAVTPFCGERNGAAPGVYGGPSADSSAGSDTDKPGADGSGRGGVRSVLTRRLDVGNRR